MATASAASVSGSSLHLRKVGADVCPLCGKAGLRVLQQTLGSHVKETYWGSLDDKTFLFCPTPSCEMVYFSSPRKLYITKHEVKTRIGVKETTPPIPVCYCKQVTEERILDEILVKRCCDSLEDIKQYTQANTGRFCHITNPSGRCCGGHVQALIDRALGKISDEAVKEKLCRTCEQIPKE